MKKYLREIRKARNQNKALPAWSELVKDYPRWIRYRLQKKPLKNGIPWITFQAIDFLKKNIQPHMKVFEYGGGGSTVFFASRVAELVTVEHNSEWFNALKAKMRENKSVKWDGNLIEAEEKTSAGELDMSNPDHYFSEDENFRSSVFKQYASYIDKFPDEYFDIVLVDGRARPSCMKHSLNKVKKAGFLILDNADRTYYLDKTNSLLGNYRLVMELFGPTPYVSWFTQTNIYKRIG